MSAEPQRTKAYSLDLRWRIIWQKLGMGLSYRTIASHLNISVGTAHNIFRLFEQTGSVDAKKPRKRPECCKIDDHHQLYIISLVLENPSMYLGEISSEIKDVTGVRLSASGICKLLAKYGFTRKKVQHVALQRCLEYRASFIADICSYPKEMIVWVDETGCDKRNLLRKYGYSLRGERAVCHRMLVRGTRISTVAAISSTGLVGLHITTGTVNGDVFSDFIKGTLIPNMLPYDGFNPTSVVIMDNCSVHHVDEVKKLLEDAGIVLIYLPPYSPDFNPIEMAFSYIKQYLKQHDSVAAAISDPCSLVQSAFNSITTDQCRSWVTHTHVYC